MATTTVGSTLSVSFSDGSARNFKLAYRPFFVTGDLVPDGKGGTTLAGGYYDINNQPIIDRSVAGKERQFYSDCPDGSSLLTLKNANVPGVKGNTVFAVVQFEYTTRDQASASQYGQLPSPIAVLTLDQDPANGALKVVKYHNVDTSKAHGLWITCGASLSPWGTHLSSEEYEPDATKAATDAQFKAFSKNTFGDETKANPYHYGHLPEITVNPDGTGTVKKHYCLGRISHELIQVMPDQRTVMMVTTPPTAACSCSSPTRRPTCPPARCTSRSGRRRRPPAQAPRRSRGSGSATQPAARSKRSRTR